MSNKRRKLAYICSPYNAATRRERKRNIDYARELTKTAVSLGFAPVAPYLYIIQCFNDKDINERTLGMDVSLDLLKSCVTIIVGARYGISQGMQSEIDLARRMSKQVIMTYL